MLPGVYITIGSGGLGTVPTGNDGIAGLLLSSNDNPALPIGEPKQIFSLKEAEALGITEDNDNTNDVVIWRQIKDFYAQAGEGAELWILLYPDTVTMTDVLDVNNDFATKLLNAADGKIRILGIDRTPDAGYSATITDGLDSDVWSAIPNAQELAEAYTSTIKPFRVFAAGRQWSGNAGDLLDLNTLDKNRVAIVLGGIAENRYEAAIGLALGRAAYVPVQRNIGRVKDGPVEDVQAYMTDGATVETHELALESIHDKGYIIFRKYVNKGGYYFADDPTATASTDDYKSFARGRVIDKALVLTYNTYIDEVNDEVEIDDGKLSASYVKALQGKIENVLNQVMTANGEISSATCTIDPTQNILSTNRLDVQFSIVPVGYAKQINVTLGFTNPAINQ